MSEIKKCHGFTLIELIMIIVILGILASVAIPKYYDLAAQARQSAERGVLGGVKSGIATYYAQNKLYPASLDMNASFGGGNCSNATVCFDQVLSQGGITDGWIKLNTTSYVGPTNTTYTYSPLNGSFIEG